MNSDSAADNTHVQADAQQLVLSFSLAGECYGIDILRVREIRGWSDVTRIPNVPDYMLGVLNLRGSIVPVIDLRRRFELSESSFTPKTVIIVLFVELPSGWHEVGIVVDGVTDVLAIDAGDVKQPPELGSRTEADYLRGLITIEETMVVLLDVDSLIGFEDTVADHDLGIEQ